MSQCSVLHSSHVVPVTLIRIAATRHVQRKQTPTDSPDVTAMQERGARGEQEEEGVHVDHALGQLGRGVAEDIALDHDDGGGNHETEGEPARCAANVFGDRVKNPDSLALE